MTRVRRRVPHDRRDDLPLSVAAELDQFAAGVVRPDLYDWGLCRYLLPRPGTSWEMARRSIENARQHQAHMDQLYPDGPESAA